MTRDDLRAHLEFYEELGVNGVRLEPEWRRRVVDDGPAARTDDAARAPERQDDAQRRTASPAAGTPLARIREDLGDCRRCKLHGFGRRQIVFGVGNPHAELMFVGEAPGADEDIQGEPFVGAAGQLLTRIIEAIGRRRDEVYIANVIKCRPPENRTPEPDEVEQCEPFLFRQIEAVQPKVIVALGRVAAQTLLHTAEPLTRMRGREFRCKDAILIPTYHPAYLLRYPEKKRDVWEDMKKVRGILDS